MHPFQFTLALLEQTVKGAPRWFAEERRQSMLETLKAYEMNPTVGREELDNVIIAFGKEIWPYRKALAALHEKYAAPREEKYIRAALGQALVGKFDTYLREGNSITDFKQGKQFETFFTPDEQAEIVAKYLDAHDKVMDEFQSECMGPRLDECNQLVEDFKNELPKIEDAIMRLSLLADESPKWRDEIMDKVRVFEEGWSGEEKDVTRETAEKEIEFYKDAIQGETE
ncbi:MAG: hypothetical protein HW383_124 [Candidatus Magasanikbacteria bacterium]|nr:hypothetical protein [Candidatus Magasanikbacteria bacterium]